MKTCIVCGGPTTSKYEICIRTTECRKKAAAARSRRRNTKLRKERQNGVYVIGTDHYDYVKIGFTAATSALRLDHAQTYSPFELKLLAFFPGSQEDEEKLHFELREFRIRREWYDLGPHPDALEIVKLTLDCPRSTKLLRSVDYVRAEHNATPRKMTEGLN